MCAIGVRFDFKGCLMVETISRSSTLMKQRQSSAGLPNAVRRHDTGPALLFDNMLVPRQQWNVRLRGLLLRIISTPDVLYDSRCDRKSSW